MTRDGILVSLSAQCVPAGGAITSWQRMTPHDVVIVVAGAPGCSIAISAHAPAGISLPLGQLENLAHDRRIQLRQ
jgi:hypothetical protein